MGLSTIPKDTKGFIPIWKNYLRCPHCHSLVKVNTENYEDLEDGILIDVYCPYCKHEFEAVVSIEVDVKVVD